MSYHELLSQLAARHGIEQGYHDIWGTWHGLTNETASALLQAMGEDTRTEQSLTQALADFDQRNWRTVLPPVMVSRDDQWCAIGVNVSQKHEHEILHWRIAREDGVVIEAQVATAELEVLEERHINDKLIRRRQLPLPGDIPHGYHQLDVRIAQSHAQTRLIRTPAQCMPVNDLRVWGMCVQLYALRSSNNWGIGDFGDLLSAIDSLATQGADFIGLNPLHALYLDSPTRISPYSPSSRSYLNSMYLHIQAMHDYQHSNTARAVVESPQFQSTLGELRASEWVDYAAIAKLKKTLFEHVFGHFSKQHIHAHSDRAKQFNEFRQSQGEALRQHALYEALPSLRVGLAQADARCRRP